MSPKFEHAYKKILGQRPTPAGDKFLLTETPATYAGIPLTRVPMIPSNLTVNIGGVDFNDITFVILTLKKNLITGIHRQMSLERDKNIFSRMRQYAFTRGVIKNYGTGGILLTAAAPLDEILIIPDEEYGKLPVRGTLKTEAIEQKMKFKTGWLIWSEQGQGVTRPEILAKIKLLG